VGEGSGVGEIVGVGGGAVGVAAGIDVAAGNEVAAGLGSPIGVEVEARATGTDVGVWTVLVSFALLATSADVPSRRRSS
jgi:hypothetical protein